MMSSDIWPLGPSIVAFILAACVIGYGGVLLLGLLRREKHGFGNIGFESVLVLVLYFLGIGMLVAS